MTDPRFKKLAKLLVEYSTALEKGDRVLLDMIDVPDEFSVELMRAARKVGATPLIEVRHTRINREIMRGTNDRHSVLVRDIEMFRMKKVQAYVAIRGSANASEASDVPSNLLALYSKVLRPVLNYRVNKTRWVVLRWPSPSLAQAANLSTEAFEDFYFNVCTMDYRKMARAMMPLAKRMKKADRVHLKAPGTDLTFSIKGIGAQACVGLRNIPDGEVFSCPVKNTDNLFRNEVRKCPAGIQERQNRKGHLEQYPTIERDSRYGRRRPLRRRIFAGLQPLHSAADVRHPVRRENRRLAPLHTRSGV